MCGVLALALGLTTGCVQSERQLGTDTRSVEIGAAKTARLQVEMSAGTLRIGGGSARLLDADFDYPAVAWRPELKYDVNGSRGYLSVRQPALRLFTAGDNNNKWDLRLNDRIPLEMRVVLGAGEGDLRLSGMALRRLEVEVGAGELRLDLTGAWDNDFEGTIHGGVGQATIRLPKDAGVRVHATGGIGEIHAGNLRKEGHNYVNDSYGKSPVHVRLDITGGIGQINLIG